MLSGLSRYHRLEPETVLLFGSSCTSTEPSVKSSMVPQFAGWPGRLMLAHVPGMIHSYWPAGLWTSDGTPAGICRLGDFVISRASPLHGIARRPTRDSANWHGQRPSGEPRVLPRRPSRWLAGPLAVLACVALLPRDLWVWSPAATAISLAALFRWARLVYPQHA